MLDGPLLDRDLFNPPYDREHVFGNLQRQLEFQAAKRAGEIITADDLANISDPEDWKAVASQLLVENQHLRTQIEGDINRLEFCKVADFDELLEHLTNYGRTQKMENFCRFFEDLDEPIVTIDEKGVLCPLRIEDGEVVEAPPPGWVLNMQVYCKKRTIAFGDKRFNRFVEKDTYRNKFRDQAKFEKTTEHKFRQSARARREETENMRREERERSPHSSYGGDNRYNQRR